MGCCLSTLEDTKPISIEKPCQFPCVSKSPPRPEEETVKEVLSETPNPKPKPKLKPEPEPEPDTETSKDVVEEGPTKADIVLATPSPKKPISAQQARTTHNYDNKNNYADVKTPEEGVSEVSEVCVSLSESISNNTLDDLHTAVKDSASTSELRHSRAYKSQGQNGHFHINNNNNNNNKNTNSSHGRSPARRVVDPSPPRRRYPGPGPGPGGLARRSRSPGARGSGSGNVGRSPSGRRAGPSPGRAREARGPKRETESEEGLVSESLENPLVSLECFIFL
ncbi:hypothetical protein vseg_009002 [Gypsophila vaccaria]